MLTPEDLTAIRSIIREEIAAANRSANANIASSSEAPAAPEDIARRIRDLEVKALLADARDDSVAVAELKNRLRNLEARILLLEKSKS
jgi:hypothetical protein